MPVKLLILADDLTGTADSAVGCAQLGLATQVMLSAEAASVADVAAVDLDSRACDAGEAVARHHHCLTRWTGHYLHLFKKVDSTLRGNLAAEIASLVPRAGMAIVAPAYPATGRTTRDGRQWLHERPVEETEAWTNEGIAGRADLVEMLEGAGLKTHRLDLSALHEADAAVTNTLCRYRQEGVQAVVCDALTDADLTRLATLSAPLERVFWVGSAGLGLALPRALGLSGMPGTTQATPAPRRRPTLIVVGSMSRISHAQADALVDATPALEVVEIDAEDLLSPHSGDSQTSARAASNDRIRQTLQAGDDVLVRLTQPGDRDAAEGPRLSVELGVMLALHLAAVDRLIATGGATARALLMAAEITELDLVDAPDTGMARLHANHDGRTLEVITKAGGFGDTEAFVRIWHDTGCIPTFQTQQRIRT
ncbi:four-carbon acid sugar kinase family protein [Modicisalibacter radicis]|uniref:four-carbon acid sugar kinase family protein n=1 Tax=Halomonas sp. EAR18 TaxID=2518972 RepID=UPI00144496CE|nr:four-carbon acid sugar kinase family protein [Halomonas sp. EAR18]